MIKRFIYGWFVFHSTMMTLALFSNNTIDYVGLISFCAVIFGAIYRGKI